MAPFAVYSSYIFSVFSEEANFLIMFSENVETHISGKPSIGSVVSHGLNKAGSVIFSCWNMVRVFEERSILPSFAEMSGLTKIILRIIVLILADTELMNKI